MLMPYSTHGKKMMTAMKSCNNKSTSGITLISVMPCTRPYGRDLFCDIFILDRRYKLVGEILHLHRLMPDARGNPVVRKQRRHGDQQSDDRREQRRRDTGCNCAEAHRALFANRSEHAHHTPRASEQSKKRSALHCRREP